MASQRIDDVDNPAFPAHTRPHVRLRAGATGLLAAGGSITTRVLLWAGLLFAINVGFLFASVFGATWLSLKGDWRYFPPMLFPLAACAVYVALVHRIEKRAAWELSVRRSLIWQGSMGFVFGAFFIAMMLLTLAGLRLYSVRRGIWTHWFDGFVYDSYVSAILEELAFRAVLLRLFARLWGAPRAVLLSSLIFGIVHITHGSWLGVLGIVVNGGITLGLLYVMTGRLWMSIGMHLGYDFAENSFLGIGTPHGFFLSTPKSAAAVWLTGGTFGPDAAIPAIFIGVILNIFLWQYTFGSFRLYTSPTSLEE